MLSRPKSICMCLYGVCTHTYANLHELTIWRDFLPHLVTSFRGVFSWNFEWVFFCAFCKACSPSVKLTAYYVYLPVACHFRSSPNHFFPPLMLLSLHQPLTLTPDYNLRVCAMGEKTCGSWKCKSEKPLTNGRALCSFVEC